MVCVTQNLNAALVGHWTLDETSGLTAADSSGNGYDGTLNGFILPLYGWEAGKVGGALSFFESAHVDVPSFPGIPSTEARSISCWVKPRNLGCRVLEIAGISLRIQFDFATIECRVGDKILYSNTGKFLVVDNEWHHVVVTVEAGLNPSVDQITIYIDGKPILEEDLYSSTGSLTNIEATGGTLGWALAPAPFRYRGVLDDVRVYNEVLSVTQVKAIGGFINQSPYVEAGNGQIINLGEGIALSGSVTDDEFPEPATISNIQWSLLSGPGSVIFDPDPNVLDPNVTFTHEGMYQFNLSASDGLADANDIVTIVVGDIGGDGSEFDPYLILTPEQMNAIGTEPNNLDKHFKLIGDIDLSQYTGSQFNQMGSNSNDPFRGVFDGNNKKLINYSGNQSVFGTLNKDATVKNLGFMNPYVDGDAILASVVSDASVRNCFVDGGVAINSRGGLVGAVVYDFTSLDVSVPNSGVLENSYYNGVVKGTEWVGGLTGQIGGLFVYNFNINACYSSGVCFSSASNHPIGGLVGDISQGSVIDSYSNSVVLSTSSERGSLVGYMLHGFIANSYGAGYVDGSIHNNPNGLIGVSYSSEVYSSYWDIDSTLQSSSAGGEGKSSAEMRLAETFSSWGCNNAWAIDPAVSRPRLSWENAGGVPINSCPEFGGGTGAIEDPYLISEPNHLNHIGIRPSDWDKHFKLTTDLDMSGFTGEEYNLIGPAWGKPFTGYFDGGGNTISNFTYVAPAEDQEHFGLFGAVLGNQATICNLVMENPQINASFNGFRVGTIAGAVFGGNLVSCASVGGDVIGGGTVGGIAGRIESASIINCYNTSSVRSFGGQPCGLVWNANEFGVSRIINCYSAGEHIPQSGVGLAFDDTGAQYPTYIQSSFWDVNTSGVPDSIGQGGTGLMTSEMQDTQTFLDAGWDLDDEFQNGEQDIWRICDGASYPTFSWNSLPGDIDCSDSVDLIDLSLLLGAWLLPTLNYDLFPYGGDGFVDLKDFTELPNSEPQHIKAFFNEWLQQGTTLNDIASNDGDKVINLYDFSKLTSNWMMN